MNLQGRLAGLGGFLAEFVGVEHASCRCSRLVAFGIDMFQSDH